MKYFTLAASILLIGLFTSCQNQPQSNGQTKVDPYFPLTKWVSIYELGNANTVNELKNLGYKYERDFKVGKEQMSIFAYNLTNDGIAEIRVFVGNREGIELIRVQFYGNTGSKYYANLLSEVQTNGQLIEKYISSTNVPCQEWKKEKIRINFCEGVENGQKEYIVELLKSAK
ncbi:MAG: hypothetical protein ACKVTZ_10405 [Bacteroidia bacterium]